MTTVVEQARAQIDEHNRIMAQKRIENQNRVDWQPQFSPWRHGGWYVDNLSYPSGAVGCVSRNYPDKKWRIACDPRPFESQPTFPNRIAAACAERDLIAALAAQPATETQGQHTPLPWTASGNSIWSRSRLVAEAASGNVDSNGEIIANAALIVRAVNSHAQMAETMRKVALSLHSLSGPNSGLLGSTLRELRDELHQALAATD